MPQGICNRYINFTAHPSQTPGAQLRPRRPADPLPAAVLVYGRGSNAAATSRGLMRTPRPRWLPSDIGLTVSVWVFCSHAPASLPSHYWGICDNTAVCTCSEPRLRLLRSGEFHSHRGVLRGVLIVTAVQQSAHLTDDPVCQPADAEHCRSGAHLRCVSHAQFRNDRLRRRFHGRRIVDHPPHATLILIHILCC